VSAAEVAVPIARDLALLRAVCAPVYMRDMKLVIRGRALLRKDIFTRLDAIEVTAIVDATARANGWKA